MSEVVFAWPVSSWFGWGIRGLGYTLNWPGTALSAMPPEAVDLGEDDPRRNLLGQRLQQSAAFQQRIAPGPACLNTTAPVFVALPNNLRRAPVAHGKILRGQPTIACPVFEDLKQVEANVALLKEYDKVVVASQWNQDVLASLGVPAILCHEGIDPVLFNPQGKKPRNDGRFRVFSGGKAEYRKGQDIVIDAFKIFAEKHDDAVLVASWGSPWGKSGSDFEGKWQYGSPPGTNIGKPNYGAWLQKAGLKPHQYEIVTPVPNWRMPEVYGSCDVAVFPNRCEGGTNFVAMEAMACGVPTITRPDYGQADLVETSAWLLPTIGDEIDGIVHALKFARAGGLRAPEQMEPYWTWERHCKEMAEIASD